MIAHWKDRVAALAQIFERLPWLLPLISFGWGWASFLLMRRGEEFARVLALLAFLGWPWLLVEPFIRRYLQQRAPGRLTELVLNFFAQSIQQELLFFSLPLILGATQLHVGQIVFAALAVAAALLSTIDPIYNRRIAGRPLVNLVFHAYCSWLAALVVLPMVVHLPLERALPGALLFVIAWILLTLPRSLSLLAERRQRLGWLACCVAIPLTIWLMRDNIPPAGLSVREARITQSIHELVPGETAKVIAPAALADGVIAFVSIRAPMGVAQSVVFEWRHGELRERIDAEIHGTPSGGWRTWSRKRNFPAESSGPWQVDVLTPDGQLIKRLRFRVE